MQRKNNRSGGVMIAMALFFAAVGILMGMGRLKAYEYQVARRLERTYQIEKMLAVRSIETLIRHKGQQFVTDNNDMEVYPVFSNYYHAAASGEVLFCQAVPTEYVELQHSFSSSNWLQYPNSRTEMPRIISQMTDFPNYVEFSVDNPASNVVYKGAKYANTGDSWLKNDRGYLYRLRLKDVKKDDGAFKTRMYIVGSDNDQDFADGVDYQMKLASLPWIMLENEVVGAGTNTMSVRNLHIRGRTTGEVVSEYRENGISFPNLNELSPEHEFGLLLSKNYLVSYSCDSVRNLYFTENRFDLNSIVDTNDFHNIWVFIENEFATLNDEQLPVITNSLKVQMFSIKEPTTYALSLMNTKITEPLFSNSSFVTWLFQTEYPPAEGRPGKQCLLDTFGTEPTSLKKERRGELKR